jgi:hypothetical protein
VVQVALVFIIGVVIFVAMRLGLKKSRLSLRAFFGLYLLALIGVALIFLGFSGRLQWPFAVLGSLLPFSGTIFRWASRIWRTAAFLRGIRGLFQQVNTGSSQKKSSGQTSEVQTDAIRMVLDHDTGDMAGEVLIGEFAGQQLSELGLQNLISLHRFLSEDHESLSILEAFLDREHPTWNEDYGSARKDNAHNDHAGKSRSGEMTTAEALEILGLEPGANIDEIKQAHRRIIQKLHPDRGGSTYLASQVNEAKDFLLRNHG